MLVAVSLRDEAVQGGPDEGVEAVGDEAHLGVRHVDEQMVAEYEGKLVDRILELLERLAHAGLVLVHSPLD